MAKRRKIVPRLAEGELEILQMLWRERAVTILEAKIALNLPIGYTTVQTRLNRLVKKGVVKKTAGRPARYSASITNEQVHAKDLDTLVDRVSGGRVTPLVAHLINREDVSAQEIRELKILLQEAETRIQIVPKTTKGPITSYCQATVFSSEERPLLTRRECNPLHRNHPLRFG